MSYCRGLSFTHDPDYKYIINLFEGCMERHGYEVKGADFIWNKNRLFLERETLKQSMMRVINNKAPKEKEKNFDEKGPEDQGAGK